MVVAVLTRVVAVLTTVVAVLECRRFGMSPFLLSPFRLVAVMTGTRYDAKIWGFHSVNQSGGHMYLFDQ